MIPINKSAIEYMLLLVNGQTASYTGRTPADLNNQYQRGTLAKCKTLVRQEHAKPDGLRFEGLLGFNADGSTVHLPLPDDWPRAPHDGGDVLETSNVGQAAQAPACILPAVSKIVPDLTEARRLFDLGIYLVELKPFSKQPEGEGWNKPDARVKFINPNATGYGMPLAANNRCSVDPDNWPLAVKGMAALGFDLPAIMESGVRTSSTRTRSGGRSGFSAEPDLAWLTFGSRETGTIIEFRADSANLQDVIPGLVYHTKDGEVCTHTYSNEHRLDAPPSLPDDLLTWWQRCSIDIDFLRDQQRIFMDAIGTIPIQSISTGRKGDKLAYSAPVHRTSFNEAHKGQELLEKHGYCFDKKTGRWYPPTATGAPSVREIPGKDGLWQSDHASDPLRGTFDAWTAYVVLEHDGDVEAAKKSFDIECGLDQIDISGILNQMGKPRQKNAGLVDSVKQEAHKLNEAPSFNDPVDLYSEYPVPEFPLHCVPKALADYSQAQSKSTGFDPGGYASILIAALGALIDSRGRIKASSTWLEPPIRNTALVDNSGGGKTQIQNAGTRPITQISNMIVRNSAETLAKWREEFNAWSAENKKTRPPLSPKKPIWHQLVVNDATTESMADVLSDNQRGAVLIVDEMTGLIGSMDAYSNGAKGGASKDKANFLRLHEGGQWVINRKTSGNLVIKNWAASIITTVQPEILAEMYSKSAGGGADGLFQRFLPYCLRLPRSLDLYFEIDPFVFTAIDLIADQINQWTMDGKFLDVHPNLGEAATKLFQDYCNAISKIALGTDQQRFKEHLSKFKGFLLRLCFMLHVIECASAPTTRGEDGQVYPPQLLSTVSAETFIRAQTIMECQYHHSFAVYETIGRDTAIPKLTRQVGEAILATGWRRFTWGDLTRDVMPWRDTKDERIKESTLDRLEAFGWIMEVDATPSGRSGRKSKGIFIVNPAVHTKFLQYAQRKAAERAERREAFDVTSGRLKPKET